VTPAVGVGGGFPHRRQDLRGQQPPSRFFQLLDGPVAEEGLGGGRLDEGVAPAIVLV